MPLTKFNSLAIASLLIMTLGALPHALAGSEDPEVVPSVDFQRYSGLWYEIAHAPNFFQRNCAASTAEYKVLDEKSVSVRNVCHKSDGSTSEIRGKATVVDPAIPAKLKVRFNLFARGDYWVVDLDSNYQWAVVSGPRKSSLFILARQAPMAPHLLQQILRNLKSRGFSTENLIFDQYQ